MIILSDNNLDRTIFMGIKRDSVDTNTCCLNILNDKIDSIHLIYNYCICLCKCGIKNCKSLFVGRGIYEHDLWIQLINSVDHIWTWLSSKYRTWLDIWKVSTISITFINYISLTSLTKDVIFAENVCIAGRFLETTPLNVLKFWGISLGM